jgi:hypothetical protein
MNEFRQHGVEDEFEFIGFWGYLVFLVYCMRRVNCKQCGVVVEEVPWGMGKHNSTKIHMHFLGHWARKLSWKETAEEFRTSLRVSSARIVSSLFVVSEYSPHACPP